MDQLRAERARFESELATGGSPGVVPETPLGEGGHEPSSSSSSQPRNDEDSVWDSDDDERPADGNAGGGTARTPMPSELLARGASVSETRDDAAAAAGDDDDDDARCDLVVVQESPAERRGFRGSALRRAAERHGVPCVWHPWAVESLLRGFQQDAGEFAAVR